MGPKSRERGEGRGGGVYSYTAVDGETEIERTYRSGALPNVLVRAT
eukprot:COSAG06_NODE_47235_length_340_cov_1.659751_1_plen_45_part_10